MVCGLRDHPVWGRDTHNRFAPPSLSPPPTDLIFSHFFGLCGGARCKVAECWWQRRVGVPPYSLVEGKSQPPCPAVYGTLLCGIRRKSHVTEEKIREEWGLEGGSGVLIGVEMWQVEEQDDRCR